MRKRSENITNCTERVKRRTQSIRMVHKGPQGMVHLERAGCTLPWTRHWLLPMMGPRTAKVLKMELKMQLKVQPKIG